MVRSILGRLGDETEFWEMKKPRLCEGEPVLRGGREVLELAGKSP